MKKSVLFLVFFSIACHCYPNTYFVSVSGDDTKNGSQSAPWKTLQHASDKVKSGDTVIVLAGTYSGFDIGWDNQTGTAEKPIVFLANSGAIITTCASRTADGINIEGANYVVIDGFTIKNQAGSITRAGIRSVENTGVVIRNNTITGMGTWGIFTGFSENIVIENNKTSGSQDEHGIYVSNSGDNPVIRGNISCSNNGCGIHMNGDISMGGDGIISNALVENNIIYNNGAEGGSGINCDGVQNSVFRNNLLYNNHSSGMSFYKIDGGGSSINNLVINNTIYMASDGRWAININSESTGNKVFNNILFSQHTYRGGISCEESSLTDFQSDYNITIDRFTINDGDNVISLTDWRTTTGQDKNSVTALPADVFVSAESNDYTLKPGCTAIDFGTDIDAPTTDITGGKRPAGKGIDAGAYEFGAILSSFNILHKSDKAIVFPNPASEMIEIITEFPIQKIEIYLLSGIKLMSFPGNNKDFQQINTGILKPGAYFIRIHGSNNKFAVQIVLFE